MGLFDWGTKVRKFGGGDRNRALLWHDGTFVHSVLGVVVKLFPPDGVPVDKCT